MGLISSKIRTVYRSSPYLPILKSFHRLTDPLLPLMGKKGGSSAGKTAAKAAKKEKQEKLASRKAAKDDKKQNKALQSTSNGKNVSGKGGKGGKSGKSGKGKAAPAEEEDLDALLKKFTQEWQEAHAVNEETVGGPPSRRANATLTPCPLGKD